MDPAAADAARAGSAGLPDCLDWLHEIKFDGYRMHARLDRGAVRLLTRNGLDWTMIFELSTSRALSSAGVKATNWPRSYS